MVKSQFIGFDIAENLSESASPDSDSSIINNLGGSGISDDLLRFYNNMRNVSTITITASNISGSLITVPSKEFIFTNGTQITVSNSTYYIKDSDNFSSFRLSTSPALTTTVSSPPTGVYSRSDAITLDNLKSLSKTRKTFSVVAGSLLKFSFSFSPMHTENTVVPNDFFCHKGIFFVNCNLQK